MKTHIQRPALPWRDEPELTECGYLISSNPTYVILPADVRLDMRNMCTVCMSAMQRWSKAGARALVEREARSEFTGAGIALGKNINGISRLEFEMMALGRLALIHKQEFDDMIAAAKVEQRLLEKK